MHTKKSMIFVAIALFFITILVGSPLGASARMQTPPGEDACRFPNAIAASGRPAEAAAQYLVLLERSPGLQCAEDGYLAAINSFDPFATARSLVASGDADAAANEIKRVSEAFPGAAVPAELAYLVSPPAADDPFATVRALDDAGLVNEAKTAFAEVVKDNPDVPDDLKHLDGREALSCKWSNPQDCAQSITNWTTEKLKWVLPFVGILAGVFVLGLAIIRLFRNLKGYQLDIVPFQDETSGATIGTTLTEAIQAHYHQLNKDDPIRGSKFIVEAEPDVKTNVSAELGSTPANLAASVYDWTKHLWSRTFEFGGTAITDPKRGAGLVLTLRLKNQIKETETIWFEDYFGRTLPRGEDVTPTSNDYLALAETAALRLYSWMAMKRRFRRDMTIDIGHDGNQDSHTTWKRWNAYALFRNSRVVANAWSDRPRAVRLLQASLAKDPEFLPAKMNLATLEFEKNMIAAAKNADQQRVLIKRYQAVLKSLWETSGKDSKHKKLRPTLLFNYLAAIDYSIGWNRGRSAPDEVKPLLQSLKSYLELNDPDIASIKPSLEFMRDTFAIRTPESGRACSVLDTYREKLIGEDTDATGFDVRFWYGNACVCAAAFKHPCAGDEDRWARAGLDLVRKAVTYQPELKSWARVDPSLTPFATDPTYRSEFEAICTVNEPETAKPERTEHVVLFGATQEDPSLSDGLLIRLQGAESLIR